MPRMTGRTCRRCGRPVFRSRPLCELCEDEDARVTTLKATQVGELEEWQEEEATDNDSET